MKTRTKKAAEPLEVRLSTGIVALDYILGGGLRVPSRVAIVGVPGVGKSRLLERIARANNMSTWSPGEDGASTHALNNAGPIVFLDGAFAILPMEWWRTERLKRDRLLVTCVQTIETTESKVLRLKAYPGRNGVPLANEFDAVLWIQRVNVSRLNRHAPKFTVVRVLKNRFGSADGEVAV